MTDERFVYISDIKDKKRTARGAFNKRTHAGKGGAVKLPSDFMSRKEIKAMNGECKTYNIKKPMIYREFKALPKDLQIAYVKWLRDEFGVSDAEIARMLGTPKNTLCERFKKLGLGRGKNCDRLEFQEGDWHAWLYGDTEYVADTGVEKKAEEPVIDYGEENVYTPMSAVKEELHKPERQITPCVGSLTFSGNVSEALQTVIKLLGDENYEITLSWRKLDSTEGG